MQLGPCPFGELLGKDQVKIGAAGSIVVAEVIDVRMLAHLVDVATKAVPINFHRKPDRVDDDRVVSSSF